MKALEEENRRLKKMYLEEKLKAEIVAEALEKNVYSPRFFARPYAAPVDCFVISNEPSKSLRLSEIGVIRSSESWIPVFIECTELVQNDPGDSGELVCQRDNNFVGMHSGFQSNQPRPEAIPGPV